jgi:hypothetical protein
VSTASPEPFPPEVVRLFWDTDPSGVDLHRHRDYVMERGDWAAMGWLRRAYTPDEMADFLRRKGERLAPRERAYLGGDRGDRAPDSPGRRATAVGGAVSEALTPAQQAALVSLARAVEPSAYYLAGGVAVALRPPRPHEPLSSLRRIVYLGAGSLPRSGIHRASGFQVP